MMGSPQDHLVRVLDVHALVVCAARLITSGPVGSAWSLAISVARARLPMSPPPSSPPASQATAPVAVTMRHKRGEALAHGVDTTHVSDYTHPRPPQVAELRRLTVRPPIPGALRACTHHSRRGMSGTATSGHDQHVLKYLDS